MVAHDAAEIGEAFHHFQHLALDCDGCVVGCVGIEHLVLPSVDSEAQSS